MKFMTAGAVNESEGLFIQVWQESVLVPQTPVSQGTEQPAVIMSTVSSVLSGWCIQHMGKPYMALQRQEDII